MNPDFFAGIATEQGTVLDQGDFEPLRLRRERRGLPFVPVGDLPALAAAMLRAIWYSAWVESAEVAARENG